MQPNTGSQIPNWFESALLWMFALYPSATIGKLTAFAWWDHLKHAGQESIIEAFRKAPRKSPEFCPSAELVRQIAEAHELTTRCLRPDNRLLGPGLDKQPEIEEHTTDPDEQASVTRAIEEIKRKLDLKTQIREPGQDG